MSTPSSYPPSRRPSMVRPQHKANSYEPYPQSNPFHLPEPFASDRRLTILAGLFLILILTTMIVAGVLAYNYFFAPISNADGTLTTSNVYNSINLPKGSEYTRSLAKSNDPEAAAWDGNSRVTVLVMGLDARDEDRGMARTDSMMLFSMDPQTKTAGMLSIPRDMWVDIPGYGEDKINTAYFKGELNQDPGAGPGLAVRTVEKFIGMPINYFAQIDFNSFVKFIDDTGGVDIKVREEMVIDPVGPNNTIFLKPGTQTFNGAQALAYARMRDMGHGDFDRAARQQQVIMGVRDNILNYYSLPKLVLNAPKIYNDVSSGVRTNMTLQDAIRMGLIVQQIQINKIQRGVITEPDQVTSSFSNAGEYILLPDMQAIYTLRDQVFGTTSPSPTPLPPLNAQASAPTAAEAAPGEEPPVEEAATEQPADGDQPAETSAQPTDIPQPTAIPMETLSPKDATKAEKAQVVVLNGTSIAGLASHTHEYLMLQGIRVIKEGNADNKVENTELRVSANKPATVNYLADLLKIPPNRIFSQSVDPNDPADIVVILGSDWAMDNPMH